MEWSNLDDETPDNLPRFLSGEEISIIADSLPLAPSASNEAAVINRDSIVEWLREELSKVYICPSEIPEIANRIVEQHTKSLVTPGTSAGPNAGVSLGATLTQATLNSIAPWEKIFIQDKFGNGHIIKIGDMIDKLLEESKDKILHIPENRTQYLDLEEPLTIVTCDENGKVTWEKITAVTKHLPIGHLVHVTTKSGREVTATQSKSFLVWDGSKLIDTNGKDIKVGDLLPILNKIPDPDFVYQELNLEGKSIKLTKEFGKFIGLYLSVGYISPPYIIFPYSTDCLRNIVIEYSRELEGYHVVLSGKYIAVKSDFTNMLFTKWISDEYGRRKIPTEILLGNKEFIEGVLDGFFISYDTTSKFSKKIIKGISFLCSRLGVFGDNLDNYAINYERYEMLFSLSKSDISGSDEKNKLNIVEDIMLDPVVTIEYVSGIEYVYDLTIPKTLNFALYNGLALRDTFHTSGALRSATQGIDAMRDIIFARKKPKNESCTIYFKDKHISYEDVLNTRQYIVGSLISDFIKDYEIDDSDNLDKYWWTNAYEILNNKKLPRNSIILRLKLNISEMYKHKVSISHLASIFEKETKETTESIVMAVYGPIGDGIIDIYPISIDKALEKYNVPLIPELSAITFLETIVMKELPTIRVKGISGIRNVIPHVIPVWSAVSSERKVNQDEIASGIDPDAWVILFNMNVMKTDGIVSKNIEKLCAEVRIDIIERHKDHLYVLMPGDHYRTSSGMVVIEFNNEKYRHLRENSIIQFDDKWYEEIDDKLLKKLKNGNYSLIIESKTSKPPNNTRWLEEIVSEKSIEINTEEILEYGDKTYRELGEVFEFKDGLFVKLDPRTKLEGEILEYGLFVKFDPRMKLEEMKPGDYISSKIKDEKKKYKDEVKNLTNEMIKQGIKDTSIKIDRPKLIKFSEFIIAETEGSNLEELLKLSTVDKTRTTCNNMYTINKLFGVEATRSFIIRKLYEVITSSGSYVNPANIMLISEFITSRGEPYGATYIGISRQPAGHLSLASVERAGKVFTQHALHGRDEDIRNVSASVAVGARMAIGNGIFEIAQDIIENGEEKTLLNDDVFTAFKRDDNYNVLAKIIPGEIVLEEEEEEPMSLFNNLVAKIEKTTIEDLREIYETPDIKLGYVEPASEILSIKGIQRTPVIKNTEQIISSGLVRGIQLKIPFAISGIPIELLKLFEEYNL